MNYRAYEALHAFVEGGSVSQAALKLHRTQPQISRLLAQLQDEAGFTILRKKGRHLALTDEGREFYRRIYGLLRAQDAVADYAHDIRQGRKDRVRILAANHIIDGLALEAVARCHRADPAFSSALNARMPADLQWWLGQQQFDLALVQLPLEHPAVDTELLCQADAVAVMATDHPYAGRAVIDAADLAETAYISLGRRSVLEHRYQAAFDARNVGTHSQVEVSYSTMAIQMAALGCGVALADPLAALAQRHTGILLKRFEPRVALHYGMVFPRHRPRSPATERLVKELRAGVTDKLATLRTLLNAS